MAKATPEVTEARVDAAFNRVLALEAEARGQVDGAREAAAQRIAQAEAEVRAIGVRADRRVQLAHRIADGWVAKALASLHDQAPSDETVEPDPRRLQGAIDALVDEMLGVTKGEPQ